MRSVLSTGAARRPRVKSVRHDGAGCHSAHWRINGFPATITVWTSAAWKHLTERPPDAQYLPCGLWCTLRMDD